MEHNEIRYSMTVVVKQEELTEHYAWQKCKSPKKKSFEVGSSRCGPNEQLRNMALSNGTAGAVGALKDWSWSDLQERLVRRMSRAD